MTGLLLLLVFTNLIITASCLNEVCTSDDDCNHVNNERCQRYDACSKGRCVCRQGHTTHPSSARVCVPEAKIGGSCNVTGGFGPVCASTADCTLSICGCPSGFIPDTDTGGFGCKQNIAFARFGESCTVNPCESYPGSWCNSGICDCRQPYTTYLQNVYFHSPYHTQTYGACVHQRARTGLGEGKRCTRTAALHEPGQFCDPTLECFYCPEFEDPRINLNLPIQDLCLKGSRNGATSVTFTSALLLPILALLKLSIY